MRKLLIIAFAFLLIFQVQAWNNLGNGICECSDCNDCTNALNDNENCSNTVKLNQSITNQAGSCINNPVNFTNRTFDCQGHTIDGDNSGTDYGIYLNGKQNNTIKNCIITNFYHGIYLYSSSNSNITSNTADNNGYYGIFLSSSNNNTLTSNTANNNHWEGISLYSSSNNNTLTSNTANNNWYGIYIKFSSNNALTDNTANNNHRGLYLYYSSDNILIRNLFCNNGATDIYSDSSQTIGLHTICNTPYDFSDIDTTGCSASCSFANFCFNCSNCSSWNGLIILHNDINVSGDCIKLGNNEILDCFGYVINGNNTGTAITTANDSTIKFCEIQKFNIGINSTRTNNIIIRFNTLHHIRYYPLFFNNSNATITNNTFYSNSWSRGYKETGTCNLTWSNNAILMNQSCADDAGCSASILFIIIAGGGLTVYYYRKTQ